MESLNKSFQFFSNLEIAFLETKFFAVGFLETSVYEKKFRSDISPWL